MEINEFDQKVVIKEFSPQQDTKSLESETVPSTNLAGNNARTSMNSNQQSRSKNEKSRLNNQSKEQVKGKGTGKEKGKGKATKPESETITQEPVIRHEPELEGQEGFMGRRPINDPFVPGEKTLFEVSYMGMVAGNMLLEIKPFIEVNSRKHYHFYGKIWTRPFFSRIYMVEDSFETMLDFETLLPSLYKLQVKETKQVKEARFFIDWNALEAFYWEKKATEEGESEKKQQWKIEPFSQDVFSSLFYLRVFPWKLGQKFGFRVTSDEKNMIFWGEIIKEDSLDLMESGTSIKTLVLKPQVELPGKMNPIGDFLIWITDDPYHTIVKIQAKLAFGTLKAQAVSVTR
ncbi:MAG: DUF3108 domain-containing protein [Pseudobdellovibrionaceae bacterium]|nr:DUF3108 domain-containing protein [Pseudobdellovibrionaceae bacterium]